MKYIYTQSTTLNPSLYHFGNCSSAVCFSSKHSYSISVFSDLSWVAFDLCPYFGETYFVNTLIEKKKKKHHI